MFRIIGVNALKAIGGEPISASITSHPYCPMKAEGHPHREVLPFCKTGRNVSVIGLANNDCFSHPMHCAGQQRISAEDLLSSPFP